MLASAVASPPPVLKRVPLHDLHVARGGKLVPFAGYEMLEVLSEKFTVKVIEPSITVQGSMV